MGLFETSQEIKRQVEHSSDIMSQLMRYAGYEPETCPLDLVNKGRRHAYFWLGKLESGLFVATREARLWYEYDSEMLRAFCENYGLNLESVINSGGSTSEFCIGVKVNTKVDSHEEGEGVRYFLLVEDLTQGGRDSGI